MRTVRTSASCGPGELAEGATAGSGREPVAAAHESYSGRSLEGKGVLTHGVERERAGSCSLARAEAPYLPLAASTRGTPGAVAVGGWREAQKPNCPLSDP